MKRKFFTTLALFVSLALTACGGGKGNGGDAEWKSDKTNHWHIVDGEQADKAKHEFEEDKSQAVAATCQAEGKKVEVCKVCGYKKETPIKKADHTYETWTPVGEGSYCGPEKEEATCKICQHKETRDCPIVQHKWVKKSDVAAADGGVAYQIVECSVCKKQAIMVATASGTINGTDKGYAPEGCIKLANADETITVAINVPEAKAGTIYLRGVMDYWYDGSNNNEGKSFSSVKDNSHTANFSLTVNGTAVDMSAVLNVTFGTLFPKEAGETIPNRDGNNVTYSQMGDAKVGAVNLQAGLNTIVFTRIDSYNMAIHDFVII